jgi:hypothetical protein
MHLIGTSVLNIDTPNGLDNGAHGQSEPDIGTGSAFSIKRDAQPCYTVSALSDLVVSGVLPF